MYTTNNMYNASISSIWMGDYTVIESDEVIKEEVPTCRRCGSTKMKVDEKGLCYDYVAQDGTCYKCVGDCATKKRVDFLDLSRVRRL